MRQHCADGSVRPALAPPNALAGPSSLQLPSPLTATSPVPQTLKHSGSNFSIAFNFYDQSSQCVRMSDSSVSYATAVVTPAKA